MVGTQEGSRTGSVGPAKAQKLSFFKGLLVIQIQMLVSKAYTLLEEAVPASDILPVSHP